MSSRFDRAAAAWDEHPARVALARDIAQAILAHVPVKATMTAVDYGCGTGLVTLALQPMVGQIIGVDTSAGMLAKLHEKMRALGVSNVETRQMDLQSQEPPASEAVDLIVSAMTLHHIAEIPRVLQSLSTWLRRGGYLALADLDTEDGSFHPDLAEVRYFGIDRKWLIAQLAELGFDGLEASTAHVVERPDATGQLRRYPVFLVCAHKA